MKPMTLDDLHAQIALAPAGTEVVLLGFQDWLDLQRQHPAERGRVANVAGVEIWHDVYLPTLGTVRFTTRAALKHPQGQPPVFTV